MRSSSGAKRSSDARQRAATRPTLDALLAEVRAEARALERSAGRRARRAHELRRRARTPCASSRFWPSSPPTSTRCSRDEREDLMALLQISEPGEAPAPHQHRLRGRHRPRHHQFAGRHGAQRRSPSCCPTSEGRPLLPSIVRYGQTAASKSATRRRRSRPAIRRTRSSR